MSLRSLALLPPKQFATLKSNFCLELPAIHQMSKNIFPIANFRKLYNCWESIRVKYEIFSEQNRMSMRKTVKTTSAKIALLLVEQYVLVLQIY